MGFFDDVGNAVGTAVNTAYKIMPVSGMVTPNNSYWDFGGKSPPPSGAPPQDPAIDQITTEKQNQAKDFRSGIPQMEKGLTRQYALKAHQDLAGQLAQIRRDSAQRGIMNSGVRLGNEAGAGANSAAGVAQMKTNLHTAALGQADQLDQDAINAGITQTQIAQQLQDNIYNQALKNLANQNSAISSIGTAVGGIAGTAAAGKGKT